MNEFTDVLIVCFNENFDFFFINEPLYFFPILNSSIARIVSEFFESSFMIFYFYIDNNCCND